MSSKLDYLFIQSWRPLMKNAVKEGVVCLQVKQCDPHLSALEVRFSRRGAIQIYTLTFPFTFCDLLDSHFHKKSCHAFEVM